jgi:hypothetical protein
MVIASVNWPLVAPAAVVPVSRTLVGPPTVVGVPVIAPVPVLSVRPAGNGSSAA